MCNNDNPNVSLSAIVPGTNPSVVSPASLLPYGMKPSLQAMQVAAAANVPDANYGQSSASISQATLDYQRLQLYDYAAGRIRYGQCHSGIPAGLAYPVSPYLVNQAATFAAAAAAGFYGQHPFSKFDPRSRFVHEEPKPQHSYIGLIGMAILSVPDNKMVLSDIYQYILDNYPYFRNRGPGWRNSIRHNLSLNDCFIKSGRSANGKGHYWAVHPANVDDFQKGDFRRRKAQRKVRKHMGLSVPDDEDSPSPPPPPAPSSHGLHHSAPHHSDLHQIWQPNKVGHQIATLVPMSVNLAPHSAHFHTTHLSCTNRPMATNSATNVINNNINPNKRRQFDVESLLAPDRNANDELSTSEVSDATTNSPSASPIALIRPKISVESDEETEEPITLDKKTGGIDDDSAPYDDDEDEARSPKHPRTAEVQSSTWPGPLNWPNPPVGSTVFWNPFAAAAAAVAASAGHHGEVSAAGFIPYANVERLANVAADDSNSS